MIVSIEEVRKILGEVSDNMSDDEIVKLVENLHVIAIDALRQAQEWRLSPDNRYEKE